MNIVHYPNPVLTQVAEEIREYGYALAKPLLKEMKEYVQDPKNHALGLAMPQIGISKRAFVAFFKGEVRICINPRIWDAKGTIKGTEGCLSLPGESGIVARHKKITALYTDENGNRKSMELKDLDAAVFQHELDHLNGILISSKFIKDDKKAI